MNSNIFKFSYKSFTIFNRSFNRSLHYLHKRPKIINNSTNTYKLTSMMGLVTITDSIRDGLKKNEIIPTVIQDTKFSPKGFLMINYEKDLEITMGNTLKPEDTSSRPTIHFTLNVGDENTSSSAESKENNNKNDDKLAIKKTDEFTLIMTDPDAPTKGDEKWSEFCHYITTNIKLNNTEDEIDNDTEFLAKLTTSDINGNDLIPYMGPGPPKDTGLHRYVFLLYKGVPDHKNLVVSDDNRACWGTGIPGYGAAEFAKEHGLELWGVNFFYSKHS